MTHAEDTRAVLSEDATQIVVAQNAITNSVSHMTTTGLDLAGKLDTAEAAAARLTDERNAVQAAFDQHMLTHATPLPTPPPAVKGYSTKFGLGGGNVVRSGIELDRRYYGSGDKVKGNNDLSSNETKGIISWESFKMPYPWVDMKTGKGDAWFKDLVASLSETVKPRVDDPDDIDEMWLSIHHEPEGDQPHETDWRDTQERLSLLVPGGSTGPIKLFLTTTGWGQLYNTQRIAQEVDWTQLFPKSGDIYGIAFDAPYQAYGKETKAGVTTFNNTWTDPNVYVDGLAKWAVQFKVEAAIGEWGFGDEAYAKDKTWAAKVMDRCITNPYKRLRGAAYFDTTLNSSHSWTLGAAGSPKRTYVTGEMSKRKGLK